MQAKAFRIEELDYRKKKDVKSVADVYIQAFSMHPWNENWSVKETTDLVLGWRNTKKILRGKIFIAKNKSDRIVGLAVGHYLITPGHHKKLFNVITPDYHYFVSEIAVHPDFHKQGIAPLLTEQLVKHAKSLDCKSIISCTHPDNSPKISLLEKHGFTKIYEHKITHQDEMQSVYYQKILR